jgi:hypothetical protein
MSNPTPPVFQSQLSQPTIAANFIALQSALLTVGHASSTPVTFTVAPGTNRVTFKICNTGTKTAYLAGSNSSVAVTPAVASSSTPTPTSGANCVSTCDAIPAGSVLQQDFIMGTDTISAICAGTDTTTLEISIGQGQ